MDLFKTALFLKKAYLIVIVFDENATFGVFAENDHFLTLFGDTTGNHCFSLF